MEIGDFVAVLQYTINLFTPLNFLGSVYNAIVMAVVDLTNLSELLAETADVKDVKDALDMPGSNESDPDTVVEFDSVKFHYPTQPEDRGLKGVSFKMKKGTTTAVVGSTGAYYSSEQMHTESASCDFSLNILFDIQALVRRRYLVYFSASMTFLVELSKLMALTFAC